MVGLMGGINLIVLCYGAYLAFLTRKVASAFNESQYIAVCIYNILVCGILILPIVFIEDVGFTVSFYIRGFGALFCCFFVLLALFGPKLYVIFFTPEKNSQEYFKTFRMDGAKKVETFNPPSTQEIEMEGSKKVFISFFSFLFFSFLFFSFLFFSFLFFSISFLHSYLFPTSQPAHSK